MMKCTFCRIIALAILLGSHIAHAQLPDAVPEAEGFSSERLERLEEWIIDYVDDGQQAGIVSLIARNGRIVHHEAYGYADMESETPMETDSLFRIFSMTKPITSVALMVLFEEGRFLLNDPVSKYLPEFEDMQVFIPNDAGEMKTEPATNPMTIQDALTHTSGYASAFPSWMNEEISEMYVNADLNNPDRTLEEKIKALAALPAMHQPGTAWEYGPSTDICGRLVEVISGMSLSDFMEERIFEPLGMDDTFYVVPDDERDRTTTVYTKADGVLTPSEDGLLYDEEVELKPGGYGLVSTAGDYVRFAQMMLNGGELDGERILGRKTVELMTANHLRGEEIKTSWIEPPGFGFGLGFSVVTDAPARARLESEDTYGWSGYANTYFFIDPVENLIGVYLAQHIPPNSDRHWDTFTTLVYQAIED